MQQSEFCVELPIDSFPNTIGNACGTGLQLNESRAPADTVSLFPYDLGGFDPIWVWGRVIDTYQ